MASETADFLAFQNLYFYESNFYTTLPTSNVWGLSSWTSLTLDYRLVLRQVNKWTRNPFVSSDLKGGEHCADPEASGIGLRRAPTLNSVSEWLSCLCGDCEGPFGRLWTGVWTAWHKGCEPMRGHARPEMVSEHLPEKAFAKGSVALNLLVLSIATSTSVSYNHGRVVHWRERICAHVMDGSLKQQSI